MVGAPAIECDIWRHRADSPCHRTSLPPAGVGLGRPIGETVLVPWVRDYQGKAAHDQGEGNSLAWASGPCRPHEDEFEDTEIDFLRLAITGAIF